MKRKKEKKGDRLKIKKNLFKEGFLEEMYVKNGKTIFEISIISNCSTSAVHRALRKLNIKPNIKQSKYLLLNDKKWLIDCYVNKKYSTTKIAMLAGCPDGDGIVYGILKNTLKIPMRNLKEAQKIRGLRDRREKSSAWKGGKITDKHGYVYIYKPGYPGSSKVGYIAEHRLVASKKIGRNIKNREVVHHINGKKNDNRPSNLIVLSRKEHKFTHEEILKELIKLKKKIKKYEKK